MERERELESLKQQFEEVDQQLQNFAVDERRLNLGREAKRKQRERNTFVPLTKEEIESIGYADRVGLQKLRLTSSKHLLQLRIHQKKQSVDGLYMIAQMQEAEEKGNLQKATQIRRIYLAYAAFIECSSWAGMILEKFEEMNARQLNSRRSPA